MDRPHKTTSSIREGAQIHAAAGAHVCPLSLFAFMSPAGKPLCRILVASPPDVQ